MSAFQEAIKENEAAHARFLKRQKTANAKKEEKKKLESSKGKSSRNLKINSDKAKESKRKRIVDKRIESAPQLDTSRATSEKSMPKTVKIEVKSLAEDEKQGVTRSGVHYGKDELNSKQEPKEAANSTETDANGSTTLKG
mmetsp:Transcript_7915/g.9535  ORF Transcript_7915/g.9535 Transcript_7915/m.9535 type:complete len:140 (+) Transcript_7915:148-567(+)